MSLDRALVREPGCTCSPLISRRQHKQYETIDESQDYMKSTTEVSEDTIRGRALELWEQHGSPAGYEAEFWGQAQRELHGEGSANAETANAVSARSGSGSDGPR
jgi:hypothetical protein